MVRMFTTGGRSERIPMLDPPKLRTMFSAFEGFCERAGYDRADTHGFDVNDIFFVEHRVGMWEANGLLEIEATIPSIVGFNNRAVCEEAYGMSDDERLSKELYVNVMERYDAHIATVPFWPAQP
jgi:hypothetical protein